MAVNAFLSFFDKANGESLVKGKERWIELQGWDWEIEAASGWSRAGSARVGKPVPGALRWQHRFDASSPTIMGYLCSGSAFPKAEIQVLDPAAGGPGKPFLTIVVEGVYITKVATSGSEEGNVTQLVEMAFRTIRLDYAA
ncbi:MAG TPA: type VI secretion system tube protein Hcp, partial [Ilumatobacteraceae bacterium]|nr:type VI secretion system tube protein Hcp [Ilumatobacteraceae bacterium]